MNKSNFKLGLGSSLLITSQLFLAGCGSDSDSSTAEATMVLKNGAVYTMDGADNIVSAVAIAGDHIIYVGDDTGVAQYVGKDTEVIDLDGKMVTPGFVDGHSHPPEAELNEFLYLTLGNVEPTVASYQQALREYRAANPDLSVIWATDMQLNAFVGGAPHHSVIDEIVSDIPVIMADTSFHGQLLNSKALELSGITAATENPAGGQVVKDENGEPTGYLSDAPQLVSSDIPRAEVTPELFFEAYKLFEQDSASKGITATQGFYVAPATGMPMPYEILHDYATSGDMVGRISWQYMFTAEAGVTASDAVQVLDNGQQFTSDWQRVNGVKTLVDGVPEGVTSFLLEPYAATAGVAADYTGEPLWNLAEYQAFVAGVDAAGYQVQTHAMGDASARMVIDAVENAYEQNGQRDARHVLVHANLVTPSDITRMGQLDIYAAMQPIWFYADPVFAALELQMLGQERFDLEYSVKDMVEAGVIISGSADTPVTPDNRPLAGIETGVTQGAPYPGLQGNPLYVRDEAQQLSVLDMLRIYTINGAKQLFLDDIVGSIEISKKADLVIIAEDITKIDPLDISETEIVNTIVNGKIVYSNTDL